MEIIKNLIELFFTVFIGGFLLFIIYDALTKKK